MSEKELLYIDDVLGHITNMEDYINSNIDMLESKTFIKSLNNLCDLNTDIYKKFYKLIGE